MACTRTGRNGAGRDGLRVGVRRCDQLAKDPAAPHGSGIIRSVAVALFGFSAPGNEFSGHTLRLHIGPLDLCPLEIVCLRRPIERFQPGSACQGEGGGFRIPGVTGEISCLTQAVSRLTVDVGTGSVGVGVGQGVEKAAKAAMGVSGHQSHRWLLQTFQHRVNPGAALPELFGQFALCGAAQAAVVGVRIQRGQNRDVGGVKSGHRNPMPVQFVVRPHGQTLSRSRSWDEDKGFPSTDSGESAWLSQPALPSWSRQTARCGGIGCSSVFSIRHERPRAIWAFCVFGAMVSVMPCSAPVARWEADRQSPPPCCEWMRARHTPEGDAAHPSCQCVRALSCLSMILGNDTKAPPQCHRLCQNHGKSMLCIR